MTAIDLALTDQCQVKVNVKVIVCQLPRGGVFYLPNRRAVNNNSQSVLYPGESPGPGLFS